MLAGVERQHLLSLKDTEEFLTDPAGWYQRMENPADGPRAGFYSNRLFVIYFLPAAVAGIAKAVKPLKVSACRALPQRRFSPLLDLFIYLRSKIRPDEIGVFQFFFHVI